MKKLHLLIIALGLLVSTNTLFAQAKKPTLMILPSDNWCEQRYFMTEFDNQGGNSDKIDHPFSKTTDHLKQNLINIINSGL